jgi:peptide/nickel transport system ATP-binding protein
MLHKKGERLPVVGDFLEETDEKPNQGQVRIEERQVTGKPEKERILSGIPDRPSEENRQREVEGVLSGQPSKRNTAPLISVRDLDVWFSSGKSWLGREKRWVKAVQGVSFDILAGETLGLVGESGCGKTTLGRSLLRLNKPVSGSISYSGTDLLAMPDRELRPFRKHIQIVFQDPYSSLNPRLEIGPALAEVLKIHAGSLTGAQRKKRVVELLEKVDLSPDYYNRYPHEFSGGQRQRIVIARALTLNPDFVVFDESVSALDVSIQAQVLNLINDLKHELGFTALFISHDLSVIRYLCDRVLVMEKGRIVETGDAENIYLNPRNEYTRRLVDAIPGRGLAGGAV